MRLDAKVRWIMQELIAEPRKPSGKIAARVGVSRTTCDRRVKEVLREKYLVLVPCMAKARPKGRKYLFVSLKETSNKVTEEFEGFALECKNVLSCDYVESGAYDYIMSVSVSSAEEYSVFLSRLGRLAYWKRSETSTVIKTVKVYQPSIDELE